MIYYDDVSKLAKMAEKSLSLPENELISFVKDGAIRAYKAGEDGRKNEDVQAEFNPENKKLRLMVRKLVVAAVSDKHKHCTPDEGKAAIGTTVSLEVSDINTDKAIIAAYAQLKELISSEWKKQNALAVKTKYQELKGKCIAVKIASNDGSKVTVTLAGGIDASLPKEEQVKEQYQLDNEIVVYVKELKNDNELIVSRSDSGLVSYVLHRNVPEVDAGAITVKATARIAGKCSRAAVWSKDFSPIDRCIKRQEKVKSDLGGEEIDFVEWYDDMKAFIVSALKVEAKKVHLIEKEKQALVEVFKDSADKNLDGDGNGLQLAQELTGYKIEVKLVNREGGGIIGV